MKKNETSHCVFPRYTIPFENIMTLNVKYTYLLKTHVYISLTGSYR